MKTAFAALALAFLAACGAEGDPQPQFGLGIGPGGISPRVVLRDPQTGARIGASPGGISAGSGPVSVAVN